VKVCRKVDDFFLALARQMPSNKNVELGGRDGFKLFKHGVTQYMLPKVRRINGGWWIAIARQLSIFLCVTDIISDITRKKILYSIKPAVRSSPRATQLRPQETFSRIPNQHQHPFNSLGRHRTSC
jgi:hypothetical protein